MNTDISPEPERGVDGRECRLLLDSLPEWFGMPKANDAYEQDIPGLDTFTALDSDGRILGFVSMKQHFPGSAEIWVMAVQREQHRHGIGRALLRQAEEWLREQGVRVVQVKTLGPSRDYEPYERTRAFYQAVGYSPLEEFPLLWDADNPCLLLVKSLV